MSDVVISRDWASTIKILKDNHCDFATALDNFLKKNIKNGNYKLDYSLMNVEKFSRAYLNGFEVEMSPMDALEEKYIKFKSNIKTDFYFHDELSYSIGYVEALEYANDTLNLGLNLKQNY